MLSVCWGCSGKNYAARRARASVTRQGGVTGGCPGGSCRQNSLE